MSRAKGLETLFNRYYQEELQNLRERAREFSRVHPAAAPMLGGQSSDPDVERLLEGVAFLTGLLRRKLDDELPEIVRGLADIVLPHYLKPIPSTSLVAFTPKPGLQETVRVPAGTTLGSAEVQGSTCFFQTCFDLEVHPLRVTAAEALRRPGEPGAVRLEVESTGPILSQWKPERLSFCLAGGFAQAADLFCLLTRYLRSVTLRPLEGGAPCTLPADSLRPAGFDRKNHLFPFPSQSFSGFRLLQEYFVLPYKFLFLDLTGWDRWEDRGSGSRFEIRFDLQGPFELPNLGTDRFLLFATPVVNLFSHDGEPVTLDHRQERVRVRPSARQGEVVQVYSVDEVTGFMEGTVEPRAYVPLSYFSRQEEGTGRYQTFRDTSPVDQSPEVFLAFPYAPEEEKPVRQTLSIRLTCTNGNLPEQLQLGDISKQTSDSPELLTFSNVLSPTAPIAPPIHGDELWRLLSHLSLNLLPLADADALKALLRIYLFPEGRDKIKISANQKRVDGIEELSVEPSDRLVRGHLVRGQEITLTVRQDHFAGLGDLLIFGAVMDRFLGEYSSMNTFTRLEIKETVSGETYVWPERLGDRPLI